MAFVCKVWHQLLLPDVTKIMLERIFWTLWKDPSPMDKLIALSRDAFSTGKFRLVEDLNGDHLKDSSLEKLVESGLLGSCTSLRLLKCSVSWPGDNIKSPLASGFCRTGCKNLKKLDIKGLGSGEGACKLPADFVLDCESLEELVVRGKLSMDFLVAVDRGSPKLKDIASYPSAEGNQAFAKDCTKLSESIVGKIGTFSPGNLELLRALASLPTFRPHTFGEDDYYEDYDWPGNLETACFWSADPSRLDEHELRALASLVSSHKCRINVDFFLHVRKRDDRWEDLPDYLGTAGMRNWARELVFWSKTNLAEVEFTDSHCRHLDKDDISGKAAAVEDHIAEEEWE
jgi:hypothetical protein